MVASACASVSSYRRFVSNKNMSITNLKYCYTTIDTFVHHLLLRLLYVCCYVNIIIMAVFQDFKLEHFRDTPKAFADLAPELIEPLEAVADSLAAHYQDPVTKQAQSGWVVVGLVVCLCGFTDTGLLMLH